MADSGGDECPMGHLFEPTWLIVMCIQLHRILFFQLANSMKKFNASISVLVCLYNELLYWIQHSSSFHCWTLTLMQLLCCSSLDHIRSILALPLIECLVVPSLSTH